MTACRWQFSAFSVKQSELWTALNQSGRIFDDCLAVSADCLETFRVPKSIYSGQNLLAAKERREHKEQRRVLGSLTA